MAAKESFYFSHDYSARNDPKLVKVLMKLGQAGKGVTGIWWRCYSNKADICNYQNAIVMRSHCIRMNSA